MKKNGKTRETKQTALAENCKLTLDAVSHNKKLIEKIHVNRFS